MRSALVLMSVMGISGLAMVVMAEGPAGVEFKQVEALKRQFGSDHPQVREAMQALAEAKFEVPLLVVHGERGWVAVREAQVMSLGVREFLVGIEIETEHVSAMFPGKRTWVPMDSVKRIIELEQPGRAGRETDG